MQGDLAVLPLIGVLELVHYSRKSGVLEVDAPIPFSFEFVDGEIVDGGILDWVGLDAILSLPPSPASGRFRFTSQGAVEPGRAPLLPFARLMGDWAHLADEWPRACGVIGSPSRILQGALPYFDEGRSVRAVSRLTGERLFDVAQRAADGVAGGLLRLTPRRAWHSLRLRHPRSKLPDPLPPGSFERLLDGQYKLGELIDTGADERALGAFVLREVRAGLHFPGAGWVLRDLAWEFDDVPAVTH